MLSELSDSVCGEGLSGSNTTVPSAGLNPRVPWSTLSPYETSGARGIDPSSESFSPRFLFSTLAVIGLNPSFIPVTVMIRPSEPILKSGSDEASWLVSLSAIKHYHGKLHITNNAIDITPIISVTKAIRFSQSVALFAIPPFVTVEVA